MNLGVMGSGGNLTVNAGGADHVVAMTGSTNGFYFVGTVEITAPGYVKVLPSGTGTDIEYPHLNDYTAWFFDPVQN